MNKLLRCLNVNTLRCQNQVKLVENYKKGGGELEKEREILIEKIEKLLKSLTRGDLEFILSYIIAK